ncbi:MAG: peptidase T [Bacteroidia bacterium]|nr:peptidase T [Bacteroidia bacterium]
MNTPYTVAERFLRYVQIDTQSNAESPTCPSTAKQKNLSALLVQELTAMGISDALLDENGYVYATVPSNTTKKVPTIFFCAHVDTAPDCSGTNVKPIVHHNYQGQDIVLPDDAKQIITTNKHPLLLNQLGNDIITASGLTLLGSDDKSGVAEIMDAAHFLINNPQIKHGDVKLFFTPDEEIGRGVDKANLKLLNADFGYTLDGGEVGDLEEETFSADGATLIIHGVSTHPGYAYNKMENAMKIAGEIIATLPRNASPEGTKGMEGFVHPTSISGVLERCEVHFILRDFVTANLATHQQLLKNTITEVMRNYPNSSYEFTTREQYRNMKEILVQHPNIVGYAEEAIKSIGLTPNKNSIRGGTDGSRLSFMGLPCPNLFAGEHAIHSKHEWVSIQDMQKSVDAIVEICKVWEERS